MVEKEIQNLNPYSPPENVSQLPAKPFPFLRVYVALALLIEIVTCLNSGHAHQLDFESLVIHSVPVAAMAVWLYGDLHGRTFDVRLLAPLQICVAIHAAPMVYSQYYNMSLGGILFWKWCNGCFVSCTFSSVGALLIVLLNGIPKRR